MKRTVIFLLVCFMCSGLGAQNRGIEAGVDIFGNKGLDTRSGYSFGANANVGWRFNEFAFFGVGVGYHRCDALYEQFTETYPDLKENYYYAWVNRFQVFAQAKMNLTKGAVSPFVSTDAGVLFGKGETDRPFKGYFCEPGIGCDFRIGSRPRVYVLLGYRGQTTDIWHHTGDRVVDPYDDSYRETSAFAGQLTLHLGFRF